MSTSTPLHLFQAFGVELEYMIVDAGSLDVLPITDRVLHKVAGDYLSEIEVGEIAWSNELALHVIELKTNGPASSLAPLADLFQSHVRHINELLKPMGARLMPTAMHPWMEPDRELKLWPHEYNPVYEAYHRIFDCRGHGWANLQSVHINLPFASDEEFGRLHAAIRLVLPILPALAASSPIMDGKVTSLADNRMEVYRHNSARIPSLAGQIIPEPVFNQANYERRILQTMYDDIAALDPQGILQHEWLNARGAIARFDRQTIEIRVLDVQECPAADLAICSVVVDLLRALTDEHWTGLAKQQSLTTASLSRIFLASIRNAELATIDDPTYLQQFGIKSASLTAGELWRSLVATLPESGVKNPELTHILEHGSLAHRIQRALQGKTTQMKSVYRELCNCLEKGRMFP